MLSSTTPIESSAFFTGLFLLFVTFRVNFPFSPGLKVGLLVSISIFRSFSSFGIMISFVCVKNSLFVISEAVIKMFGEKASFAGMVITFDVPSKRSTLL